MSKRGRATATFLAVLSAVLLASALSASAASAAAEWRFGGTLFTGSGETAEAKAAKASFTVPGLTTSCEPFVLELEVENPGGGGAGVGEVTGVLLGSCKTNSKFCTVESAQAEGTPWPPHLATVTGEHYLVVEAIEVAFIYGGELCALNETEIVVKGSAAGLVNDSTHTASFGASALSGVFALAATGTNAGLAVTVL